MPMRIEYSFTICLSLFTHWDVLLSRLFLSGAFDGISLTGLLTVQHLSVGEATAACYCLFCFFFPGQRPVHTTQIPPSSEELTSTKAVFFLCVSTCTCSCYTEVVLNQMINSQTFVVHRGERGMSGLWTEHEDGHRIIRGLTTETEQSNHTITRLMQ